MWLFFAVGEPAIITQTVYSDWLNELPEPVRSAIYALVTNMGLRSNLGGQLIQVLNTIVERIRPLLSDLRLGSVPAEQDEE